MNFQEFFTTHSAEVYFVYGMAFFIMGFAIALQKKNFSNIPLAKCLKYLALFGFAHGLVEWSYVFHPIQETYIQSLTLDTIIIFRTALNTLSFMFLFMFGIKLYAETVQRWRKIHYIPVVVFLGWLVLFIVTESHYTEFREWIKASNMWSRYILALPGSIISAYAIYLQIPHLVMNRYHVSITKMKQFCITFLVYAFAAGIVTPKTAVFPATIINSNSFIEIFGFPVYLLRALCGVFMAYYAVHMLRIFKQDIEHRLEQAEILNSIYDERQRFSRDLHDGIIQSVYGVGLFLENVKQNIDEDPSKAKSNLKVAMGKLDDVIVKIRAYINDLRDESMNQVNALTNALLEVIHDFREYSGIVVEFKYNKFLSEYTLPIEFVNNIRLIVFELLTNVIKHAHASKVTINLTNDQNMLVITIADNGKGMSTGDEEIKPSLGYKQGLKNVKDRVYLLHGSITIQSEENNGTNIQIQIPLGDEKND